MYFGILVHFGSLVFRLFSFAFFSLPAKLPPQRSGGVQSHPRNGQGGCKVIPAKERGGAKVTPQRRGGVQSSPRKGEGGVQSYPLNAQVGGCKDERASLKRVRIRVQNRAKHFFRG